jgi:isopentenyl diphosphate isomerase/L-lactate dehydrogenase-like FMN-dependent dehydrogenase
MDAFHDVRRRARRRLPRVAFDFVDGGADDEVTLRRNESAFDDLALIPRVLRAVGGADASVEVFGQRLDFPVVVGPAGAALVAGPHAYETAGRGALAAGTIGAFGAVGDLGPGLDGELGAPHWFQLYLPRDREAGRSIVEGAQRAGFAALVYTVDTPTVGNRERDLRNGLTVPLRIVTPRIAWDAARRPGWLYRYFASSENRRETLRVGLRGRVRQLQGHAATVRALLDADQTWDDVRWLRDIWEGPLVLKGVMCGEDAQLALDAGCDGVVVSNHGGRQLDGTPATIEQLPEVVAAVGGRGEVFIDGGIRRGTDVVKALCLGAKACLVARPWVFAVSSDGEQAVTRVLEQFHTEIVRTFQLLGVSSVGELGPEILRRRPGSGWERVLPPVSVE